jgi:predicted RNase H-like HicB family nuclease
MIMSRERCRTYTLAAVVEPAEGAWHAHCPVLLDCGAATWGTTREEALEHLREMVARVVEGLAAAGAPIPIAPAAHVPGATERVVVILGGPAA